MSYLFVLEFLGTNELLVILVVALILLGPRKLPQISRKVGKSLADFKRTSEDFKRTWEREVEMESADKAARIERALPSADNSILDTTVGRDTTNNYANSIHEQNPIEVESFAAGDAEAVPAPSVTPVDPGSMQPVPATASDEATPTITPPTRKRDWL